MSLDYPSFSAMVDTSLCYRPSYHSLRYYSYKSPYKRLRQISEVGLQGHGDRSSDLISRACRSMRMQESLMFLPI